LRINLFGTTDFEDTLTSGLPTHQGGRLIEFFWNGEGWQWGQIEALPVSHDWGQSVGVQPFRFRVNSAVAVDAGPWEKISVFGEDEDCQVWERTWDGFQWQWQQH
jgi:hypothetical protein